MVTLLTDAEAAVATAKALPALSIATPKAIEMRRAESGNCYVSCHFTSHHITSHHITSHHITSCRVCMCVCEYACADHVSVCVCAFGVIAQRVVIR